MAAQEFPRSYKDPLYASLDAKTEEKLGLPTGLLSSIRENGERSNADQVSEAAARTPYQFIPATRQAVIKKYGVDPYLSPETASEAAGLLLKESLDRNKGDPALAVAEYHGGTDRSAWGARTKAYVQRVTGALAPAAPAAARAAPSPGGSTFDRVNASMQPQPSALQGVLKAYQDGRMSPEDAAAFESEVSAGRIALPNGVQLKAAAPSAIALPESVAKAYLGKTMTPEDRRQVDALIKSGVVTAPVSPESQIPGQSVQAPPPDHTVATPGAPDPTLGETLVGTGEAALNAITGATGGAAGMVVGTAGGIARSVMDGTYGTPEGVRTVEQNAARGAQALTYEPRTESGRSQAEAVAAGAQALIPIAPMGAEMAMAGRLAGPAAAQISPLAQQAMQSVRRAPAAMPEAVRPPVEVPPVAPAAPAMTAPQMAQAARNAADGGFGAKKARAVLAEQAAPDPKTVAAAQRLGIEDHLQPDHVTTSQAYRELAQAVKSVPGSEARAAELAGYESVGARASALIDEIGGTTDVSTLSSDLKARMASAHEALEKQADKLYAEVRESIPAKAAVNADGVLAFIKERAAELGGVENLTPMEKRIASRLAPKTSKAVETVAADPERVGLMLGARDRKVVTETAKGPTYALLDDVRRDVGAAARMAGPFKDADTGLAKKLYGLITADQEAAAAAHGAADLFKAAKSSVEVRKALEDDMAALFGKALDKSIVGSLSQAVGALPKGDAAQLVKLITAVPVDMRQQVVASGVATAFRSAATRGPISFTNYAKFYEGLLRNKQAYTAVMTHLPQRARKQLSDLYRVSQGISAASKERITTGRIQAVQKELAGADSLATRIYEGVKRNYVGAAAGTAAGAVLGPGAGAAVASALSRGPKSAPLLAADALLISPEFLQLAKAAAKAPEAPPPAAKVRAFARSQAFNRYVRALGNPPEMKNRELWVQQVVYGQIPQDPSRRGK